MENLKPNKKLFNAYQSNNVKTLIDIIEVVLSLIFSLTQHGIPHSVYTGVVIWYKDQSHKFTEVTTVYMAYLSDEEILAYVETGEPM